MTEGNDFIQSAYIHYTLDVTGPVDRDEGTYYSRDEDGTFITIPFTQQEIAEDPVSEYWYYAPIRNRKALWTEPYYDGSIDDYLITYVEPVFLEEAEKAGLMNLKGHWSIGGIRASIYNAMPKDGVIALINFMQQFERENL